MQSLFLIFADSEFRTRDITGYKGFHLCSQIGGNAVTGGDIMWYRIYDCLLLGLYILTCSPRVSAKVSAPYTLLFYIPFCFFDLSTPTAFMTLFFIGLCRTNVFFMLFFIYVHSCELMCPTVPHMPSCALVSVFLVSLFACLIVSIVFPICVWNLSMSSCHRLL